MTAALEDAHEDRLGLCPFRGTVAASAGLAVDHGDANVLFGGIVGGEESWRKESFCYNVREKANTEEGFAKQLRSSNKIQSC